MKNDKKQTVDSLEAEIISPQKIEATDTTDGYTHDQRDGHDYRKRHHDVYKKQQTSTILIIVGLVLASAVSFVAGLQIGQASAANSNVAQPPFGRVRGSGQMTPPNSNLAPPTNQSTDNNTPSTDSQTPPTGGRRSRSNSNSTSDEASTLPNENTNIF